MTETQLKTKVQKYLDSIGAFHRKLSDRFTIGIPDMFIVHQGRTIFIELKKPAGGRYAPLQQWTIAQINNHGGEAYVCRSVDEVKRIVGRGPVRETRAQASCDGL